MLRLLVICWALVAMGCGSEPLPDDRPTEADCGRLREHEARLRLGGVGDEASAAALREHLVAAAGETYLAACRRDRTVAEVDCALAATDSDAFARCAGAN